MNGCLRIPAILALAVIAAAGLGTRSLADDSDSDPDRRLTLADLAGYRAALAGKPTADDAQTAAPATPVAFKDLWNHTESFRGRRVTVQGRVSRMFRQGPVGSFPPLAEVWITSPAGDPFCVVFPQPASPPSRNREQNTASDFVGEGTALPAAKDHEPAVRAPSIAGIGRAVRFTGTFLKMVHYEASDGGRLAPLVVGNQVPTPIPKDAATDHPPQSTASSTGPGELACRARTSRLFTG